MDAAGCFYSAGHGAHYERGTVLGIAAHKDVLGIFRVLWLQESHGQQAELCLNDEGLALLHHDGTTALGVGFPVYFLHLHTRQSAVLTQELERIDVPATGAAFLVARGSLERAGKVGPGVLWVVRPLHWLGHNLYLRHALATLTMSGAYTVTSSITATDDQHVLAFGGDALVDRKLHACQHPVLLREQFEGEMHSLQFASRHFQVTGCWRASGDDAGIK